MAPNTAARVASATTRVGSSAATSKASVLPSGARQPSRVSARGASRVTLSSTRTAQWAPAGSVSWLAPMIAMRSPGSSLLSMPASHSPVAPGPGRRGCDCWAARAFQSACAGTASTVSKVWACSSWPGTLCTRVPTGIVIGFDGTPGSACSVNARWVEAATPGAAR